MKQEEFNTLFHTYFVSVSHHLVREHKAMHKREKRNYQLLTTKGEIPEERQAENEAAQKAYDKLLTSVSTLAVSGEGGGGLDCISLGPPLPLFLPLPFLSSWHSPSTSTSPPLLLLPATPPILTAPPPIL